MNTAIVISPHGDDAAAFCGGTIANFADQGWRVVLVRVTDDRTDSVGLNVEETLQRNRQELQQAASILGVHQVLDLGFETDTLADVPLGHLRERFVYLFRRHRPYSVLTFDPFGLYEDNQDHVRCAQAVNEAFWVACFDKHYPEHFAEGLEPFSVCERWYFARQLPEANHYEDITCSIERKVQALCAHREMMRNTLNQSRLQLKTWGRRLPLLEDAMQGDLAPLLGTYLYEQGRQAARAAGWDPATRLAEAFRLVRFGDLEELFQSASEILPGAETPAPDRPSLDLHAQPGQNQ